MGLDLSEELSMQCTPPTKRWIPARRQMGHFARFWALGFTAWVGCCALECQSAHAQQERQPEKGNTEESETANHNLAFDLGRFVIKEVHPTRNETTKVSFEAHFSMASVITEADLENLQYWKHRLRDQIIIAIRTAHPKDFQEPELVRLRRIILFRAQQLLKAPLVENILLSEFTFSTE